MKSSCQKRHRQRSKSAGEEITGGGNFNYSAQGGPNSGGEGVAYHGFSAKDEEVEIDHVNYYQAVDAFFKNDFSNEEHLPMYLLLYQKIKRCLKKWQNELFQSRTKHFLFTSIVIFERDPNVYAKADCGVDTKRSWGIRQAVGSEIY